MSWIEELIVWLIGTVCSADIVYQGTFPQDFFSYCKHFSIHMCINCHEGSVTTWNVIEVLSEIWNFIRIFPFTVSMHLLYIYMYWFSVYSSALTSLILSFSLFQRTLKVEKHHKNVKWVRFPWNCDTKFEIQRNWNMEITWNLAEI